jgi:hypothetical protein
MVCIVAWEESPGMKIHIHFKSEGSWPAAEVLFRRVNQIQVSTSQCRLKRDHQGPGANEPVQWPTTAKPGRPGILPPATSRTLTRLVVGLITLLALGEAARAATFRYASANNRIYVENGGAATLTDIKAVLPNAPLQLVNPASKIWLLSACLLVADGCTLSLHGDGAGGDVNELRLMSNDNTSVADGIVCVDADWGMLDLNSTRVTSWNQAANGPDTEQQVYKRAFIRARFDPCKQN